MSGIEWGVAYRRLSLPRTMIGRWSRVTPCGSREHADRLMADFAEDDQKWETSLQWRTAVVEPGPWQEGEPPTQAVPVPLADLPEGYIITFGMGQPLRNRYLALRGTEDRVREITVEIFGANWSRILSVSDGVPAIQRHGWTRLLLGIPAEEGFNPVPTPTGSTVSASSRPGSPS